VRDQWRSTSGGAVVLIVAASDVDLVERISRPRLPRRLCVVASRYSADQVRDVEATFATRHRSGSSSSGGRAGSIKTVSRTPSPNSCGVTDDLADWADTLPGGLLELRPSMTPSMVWPVMDTSMARGGW